MTDSDDDLSLARPPIDFEDLRAKASVAERLFGVVAPKRLDRFTLRERLGAGTFGVVYAAHDPRLDRRIALKVLHLRPDEPRSVDVLLAEPRAAARLEHPAVVSVYDAGVSEDALWIAMEQVDGVDLRSWIQAEPRAWPVVVELFVQAAEGLHAAHAAGLVHRDFKPDNVLVEEAAPPRARIVDFGLAVEADAAPLDLEVSVETSAGGDTHPTARPLAGTPAYMAPEQARGAPVTAAADQFAFCVSLFEALHGVRPFEGPTLGALQDAVRRGAMRPGTRAVPRWLQRVIVRGLRSEPAERWPDMAVVARRLRAGLTRRSRRPWVLGAAAMASVLGVVAGRAASPDPCADADADAVVSWSADRADALAQRLQALAPARDPAYAERTVARFDEWIARWSSGRTAVCERARSGAITESAHRVRAACYAGRLAAFDGLLATATRTEPSGSLTAADLGSALDRLPALSDCDDPELLRHREAWEDAGPDDANARAEVRADLDRILGALTLPPDDTTAAALDDAAARADALGYPPLMALAERLRAGRAQHAGDYDASVRHAALALRHAIAGHDELSAAETTLHLMWVTGELQRDPKAAAHHAALADAYITALGDPPSARVRWLDFQGVLDLAAGDRPRARARFEQALALRETDPELAATAHRTLINLADAESGDPTRALALTERALEGIRAHLGEGHPSVAQALSNAGAYLDRLGRDEEARESFEAALAIKADVYGPAHPALASTLNNLGSLQPPEQAAETYRRALAMLESAVGPDSPRLANTVFNLGNALHGQERHAEARAQYERYQAILVAAHGEAHPGLLAGRVAVAGEQLHEGRVTQARAALEALVDGLDPDAPLDPFDRADAWSQLARARAADGASTPASLAARQARTLCGDLPECLADDVAALIEEN